VNGGAWIRPVSNLPNEALPYPDYCYDGDKSPEPLDVIDVPLLNAVPHDHQTENHRIFKDLQIEHILVAPPVLSSPKSPNFVLLKSPTSR